MIRAVVEEAPREQLFFVAFEADDDAFVLQVELTGPSADGYCVSHDGATAYRCLEAWDVSDGVVTLRFSAVAADATGLDRDLRFAFTGVSDDVLTAAFHRLVTT